jgi:hypothetical protein
VALSDAEHNLTKAVEKLGQDIKASNERHKRQLGEIYGLIKTSMRDIASHKNEVDAVTRSMGLAAQKCLKETEERILNNPLN